MLPVILVLLCCSLQWVSCTSQVRSPADFAGYAVLPEDDSTESDSRWATYLASHLRNRMGNERLVSETEPAAKDMFRIVVHVDTLLAGSFRVERMSDGVRIVAASNDAMRWLQYQLMKTVGGEDARVEVSDLPPATVGLCDTSGRFAFDFRSVYSLSGLDADQSGILAMQTLDEWGIWGHRFGPEVLGTSEKCFAKVDGEPYEDQYCFSAEETFRRTEQYIVDNFGEGDKLPMRFVVAPTDDAAVCLCDACRVAGNTPKSATPAVAKLVTRLCNRFPRHQFFLLGYLSTHDAPLQPLPNNAGVWLSAMDLPLKHDAPQSGAGVEFTGWMGQWKGVAKHVYVWDYTRNFDDYLTPFPVLELLRERFAFYASHGVNGVFLNGSGYDYAAFDDMQTWVIALLMLDPGQSVESLIATYFAENYPRSGALLTAYCCSLERAAAGAKRPLNIYGGMVDAENGYLDAGAFVRFYKALCELLPQTEGTERKQLHQLVTALSYTRLELARRHAADAFGCLEADGAAFTVKAEAQQWMEALEDAETFPAMKNISEAGLEVQTYLADWRSRIGEAAPVRNLLAGAELKALSPCDEQYTDLSVLADGVHGLPCGYHYGWHISSADLELEFPAAQVSDAHQFSMDFLVSPHHRIQPPQRVEIYRDDVLLKTITPVIDATGRVATASGAVDFSGAQRIRLKVVRPAEQPRAQLATDEIYLLP